MVITELGRRIRNVVGFGNTTTAVRIGPDGLPVVQVVLATRETFDLRIVEQRGVASNLPVGTPVTALFCGGDRSNGIIIGSTSTAGRPALTGDEAAALSGHGWSIVIEADGIHITGPVFVNGAVMATGEVTAKAGTTGSVTLSAHHGHNGGPATPTPGT